MYVYEEGRELIENEPNKNPEFVKYCYCSKLLCSEGECSCKYLSLSALVSPCVVLSDVISFVPQVIINNIKLCFI